MPSVPTRLDAQALQALATQLPQWTLADARGGCLQRSFQFHDFAQAFGFMAQVAVHADRLDHHPEWSNVHSRVAVTLTTHDAGGLSQRDVDMALRMDRIAAALMAQEV